MGLHARFVKRLHKKYRALTPDEEQYVYNGCMKQICIYLWLWIIASLWESYHAVDFWECLHSKFSFGFLLAGQLLFYVAYLINYMHCVRTNPGQGVKNDKK